MNDRDRLIELLKKAGANASKKLIMDYDDAISDNADYLLSNGVIVPPCKVGDTVYIIENGDMLDIEPSVCGIVEDEVYEMSYGATQSGELKWLYLVLDTGEDFYDSDIGKTVFLTKKEVEQALEERSEQNAR